MDSNLTASVVKPVGTAVPIVGQRHTISGMFASPHSARQSAPLKPSGQSGPRLAPHLDLSVSVAGRKSVVRLFGSIQTVQDIGQFAP
jgi:hypothetical protein